MHTRIRTPKQVWMRIKEDAKSPAFLTGFICGAFVICVWGFALTFPW